MPVSRKTKCSILILWLVLGVTATASAQVVAYAFEIEPLIYADQNGMHGMCFELLNEAAKRAGISIEVRLQPWTW